MKRTLITLSSLIILSLFILNVTTYNKVSTHTLSFDAIEKITVGQTLINLNNKTVEISTETETKLWLHDDKYESFTLEVQKNIFEFNKYHVIDKQIKLTSYN
ncbi:hypothetical protein [Cytobacillus praedii]|uniref:hypothetical protein n=1 Tax=Cytobacillus praedii TaxID=1742358 RepID=UPI002E1EC67F|nr:hypothetical protein [Cytobacillus praedii]